MDTTNTIQVKIIRPDGIFYDAKALSVVFPASDGQRAILSQHVPMIAGIGQGILKIERPDQTKDLFYVQGGTLENRDNQVFVLSEVTLKPSEVDVKAATNELALLVDKTTDKIYTSEQKFQDIQRLKLKIKLVEESTKK